MSVDDQIAIDELIVRTQKAQEEYQKKKAAEEAASKDN